MSEETSLQKILQQLNPSLSAETYVFVGVNNQSLLKVLGYDPLAFFKEPEGITLILRKTEADNNLLKYDKELCRITFNAPYHFECAGLNAIIASALAKAGIGVTPIKTLYKRSILVDKGDAHTALEILQSVQTKVQGIKAH